MDSFRLNMLVLSLFMCLTFEGHAQNENSAAFKVKPEDVLASCHANDYLQAFQTVAVNFSAERKKLMKGSVLEK